MVIQFIVLTFLYFYYHFTLYFEFHYKTIKNVIQAIKSISSKEKITERIHVNTRDEIKDLAHTTNHLLDEISKREWLQTELAELILMYQGVSSIEMLGKKFLVELYKNANFLRSILCT